MTLFEEISALSPMQFFTFSWDCPSFGGGFKASNANRLPHLSEMLSEEPFSELYMGWNERGITLEVRVKDRTSEDSVELFFDTRDLKTKSTVSKFCHHFVFTPDEKEGTLGREITRFRNEDTHRLCNPKDLRVDVKSSEVAYALRIEIPAHCLHGYEPREFSRLGFTYRINRHGKPAQHFVLSSEEFSLEQHPSLWATVRLLDA